MTMAIVEGHTFKINDIVGRYGWTNDMAAVPEADGTRSLYSVKAPAASYAGVPFYWAMTKYCAALRASGRHRQEHARGANVVAPCDHAGRAALRGADPLLPLLDTGSSAGCVFTTDDVVLGLCAARGGGASAPTTSRTRSASRATRRLAIRGVSSRSRSPTRERALYPVDVKKRPLDARVLGRVLPPDLATLLEYHALPVSVLLALYGLAAFWRPTRLVMFGVVGCSAQAR